MGILTDGRSLFSRCLSMEPAMGHNAEPLRRPSFVSRAVRPRRCAVLLCYRSGHNCFTVQSLLRSQSSQHFHVCARNSVARPVVAFADMRLTLHSRGAAESKT